MQLRADEPSHGGAERVEVLVPAPAEPAAPAAAAAAATVGPRVTQAGASPSPHFQGLRQTRSRNGAMMGMVSACGK